MGLPVAGALGLSSRIATRAGTRVSTSSGLLLLYLSTSSLLANAATPKPHHISSHSSLSPLPTCPLHSSTCPAISGPRSFHTSSHDRSSSPQYSYHVAASYSSKADHFDAERNLYTSSVFDPIEAEHTSLEKCKAALDRRKRAESGQDSFFYSQVGTTGATAFGVADGVGGWTESGIDPADFAHGLCEYMACAARMWPKGTKTNSLHPKDLLQVGYDQVQKDASIVGGGSTACLAVAEPDGKVEVANLGDSGFMHLGLNAVRHFTQPQTHEFNMPYQMSKIPQRMRVQMAIFGSTSASDMPKDSNVTHHHVQHGDVLVFATDGVWDNLFPQDVLSIVSRAMVRLGAWVEKGNAMAVSERLYELTQADRDGKADIESLQAKIAVAIAKEAKVTGLDPRRNGPFAREVKKYFPHENYWGGKPDDIAAVVAVVVDNNV